MDAGAPHAPPAAEADSTARSAVRSGRALRRAAGRATLVALAVGLVLLGPVAHRALDVMVGTPLDRVLVEAEALPPTITNARFRSTLAELIQRPLLPGNRFELLTSGGETYPRLWRDLRAAERTITLQVYYCEPSAVADSLRDILIERARAGVVVRYLADGFGCRGLKGDYREGLEAAGVQVAILRPIRWYTLHRAQHRSHVRAVVVDGRIGYTGGFGIDDKWFDPARREREWRETNVRMAGPAVRQLQATFAAGWVEATGELLAGEDLFPPALPAGVHTGAVLHSTAGIGSSAAERLLALSIVGARRTLFITNSYFVPDREFRRLLREASARGVDVRILTAGPQTDVRTTLLAGRSHYEELLGSGVRVYEFQPAMIHTKSLVADGAWITVGTMNFDNRSLRLNEESNLITHDAALGSMLDSLFRSQLGEAREIRLSEFARRPWWQHLLESGAGLLWFLL